MMNKERLHTKRKNALIVLILFLVGYSIQAQNIYITTTGAGDRSGTSWSDASNDLSLTLFNATSGTTVHVGAGTYIPALNMSGISGYEGPLRTFLLNEGVTIIGGYPENGGMASDPQINKTILSGNNIAKHIMTVASAGAKSRLQGLTFANGVGNYGSNGAFYSVVAGADVELEQCVFDADKANIGGGIYMTDGTLTVNNTTFANNEAKNGHGGAIYLQNVNAVVTNSSFLNSTAQSGGALYCSGGSIVMNNCVMSNNSTMGIGKGGACYFDNTDAKLSFVTMAGNSSQNGGSAIYYSGGKIALENCTIAINANSGWGGGSIAGVGNAQIDIENSIVSGNITLEQGKEDLGGGNINITNSVVGRDIYTDPETEPIRDQFAPDSIHLNEDGTVDVEVPSSITLPDGTEISNPVIDEEMGAGVSAKPSILLNSDKALVCGDEDFLLTAVLTNVKGVLSVKLYMQNENETNNLFVKDLLLNDTTWSVNVNTTDFLPAPLVKFFVQVLTGKKQFQSNVVEIVCVPRVDDVKVKHIGNVQSK